MKRLGQSLPYLAGIVLLTLYQWFVAPMVADLRDDWRFLHAARQNAIQQMRQQQTTP